MFDPQNSLYNFYVGDLRIDVYRDEEWLFFIETLGWESTLIHQVKVSELRDDPLISKHIKGSLLKILDIK